MPQICLSCRFKYDNDEKRLNESVLVASKIMKLYEVIIGIK